MAEVATPCGNCKQQIAMEIPQMEIVNSNTISQIVFVHANFQTCPHCGQDHQFKVFVNKTPDNLLAIGYVFAPVQQKKDSLIKPPSGIWMPNRPGET